MSQNYHNWNRIEPGTTMEQAVDGEAVASKTFITQVFGWMAGALVITGATAYLFGTNETLWSYLYTVQDGYLRNTPVGWAVMLSPIAFILIMGIGMEKFSLAILSSIFVVFSAVMGASLGYIFLVYNIGTIVPAFFITAGMFGTMSIMGWITKADLSRFGAIMFMGLSGVVLAMLVNYFFLKDGVFGYVLCIAAVALFTGLTAWDVQNLKKIGAGAQSAGSERAAKWAIMGALTLYMRFINIFLLLLRLMGGRK